MTAQSILTNIPRMNIESSASIQPSDEDDLCVAIKTSRSEKRTLATRRKLLNAARAVFSEKGFDLARIDDITERADVGKGTFYNYYQKKEDLIAELIENMLRDLVKLLKERCSNASDLNQLLDTLIAAHIKFFSDRWEDFVLFFQGRTDLTLLHSYSGIETPYINYLKHVEKLIAGVMHQKISQNVLNRIACAVVGFVSGYYSFAVVASNDDDIDGVFASLRGAMVASLVRFIREATTTIEKEKI